MPQYHSDEEWTESYNFIIIYMHMTGIKDKMEKLHVIKNRSDQDENGEGDEN